MCLQKFERLDSGYLEQIDVYQFYLRSKEQQEEQNRDTVFTQFRSNSNSDENDEEHITRSTNIAGEDYQLVEKKD